MGEDLTYLPKVLDHARRTRRIMLQNIGMSFLIIAVLIPMVLFGALSVAAMVLIHELAEVLVIGNDVPAGHVSA